MDLEKNLSKKKKNICTKTLETLNTDNKFQNNKVLKGFLEYSFYQGIVVYSLPRTATRNFYWAFSFSIGSLFIFNWRIGGERNIRESKTLELFVEINFAKFQSCRQKNFHWAFSLIDDSFIHYSPLLFLREEILITIFLLFFPS